MCNRPGWIVTCATLMTCIAAGCNRPQFDPAAFQRSSIPGASYQHAYNAAERALAERFRIAERDAERGMLRAASADARLRPDGSHPISETFGVPRRARRVAEVHVRRDGSAVQILCRVLVQENETESARMLARERDVYDQPTETPADTIAGTTEEQNTVWRTRRRDRAMERQIMASIHEILQADD